MINIKPDTYKELSGKTSIGTELLFAALAFSLIIIYVLVAPQYKQSKIVKEQIRLNQKSIEMKETALKKIKNYNTKNKELKEEDLEKFKSLLQEKNNFESYLASINKIANMSESRVSLSDFSTDKSAPAVFSKEDNINGLQTVKISFVAKGSFDKFMSFLNSLEKSVPLMELNSLSLTNITEEGVMKSKADSGTDINPEEEIEKIIFVESDIEMSFYYIDEKAQSK